MLKMKEALDFCGPMNEVGNDFMKHLTDIKQPNNEVVGLEKEIFKWAFECKFVLLCTPIIYIYSLLAFVLLSVISRHTNCLVYLYIYIDVQA